MSGSLVLAIDQGTSSTKALLVDSRGEIVGRAQTPVSLATPEPGWVQQDGEEIWSSVRRAASEAIDADAAKRVVSVGLSTQREILHHLGSPNGRGADSRPVVARPAHGRDLRGSAGGGTRRHDPPQERPAARSHVLRRQGALAT